MALRIWNPFRPHVAKLEVADLYVVRKLSIIGWMYKDRKDEDGWWTSPANAVSWCVYTTPTEAAQACFLKKKPFARLYAY